MSKFIYKLDTFIFEKENSISIELCNDIIENYEKYNNTNEKYDIDANKNLKIKNFLIGELISHFCMYNIKINKIENYKFLNIGNIVKSKSNFKFFIEKNNKTDSIKIIDSITNDKLKTFMYIWFLNDYDGELMFCNEYIIKPKAGNFILFPISWYFTYEELINLESKKYIIYGYTYDIL